MGVLEHTLKIANWKSKDISEEQRIIETLSILEHGFESPVLRGKGYSVNEAVNIVNNRINISNLVKDDLSFIKDGDKEAGVSAEFAGSFVNAKKKILRNVLLAVPFALISVVSWSALFSETSNAANTNHTSFGAAIAVVSTLFIVPILGDAQTKTRRSIFERWKFFRNHESEEMMRMIALDQKISNMSFDQLYAESHNLEYSKDAESELLKNSENDTNLDNMKITHEEIMSLKEIFNQPKLTEAEVYVIQQSGMKQKKK